MEENREKNNKKIEDEKRLEQDLRQMADDVILPDSLEPEAIQKMLQARQEEKQESALKGNIVTAPIVGTFYQSSSPEKEPFVKVGQTIQEGDVVCIIEAMKLFNEVQSDYSGVVKKILVQDGDLMEYGQPIMIIE